MKKVQYLIIVGLLVIFLNSCTKSSDSVSLVTRSESVTLSSGYANDIYYRMSDGLMTSVPRANWDIAFCVAPREAAILANTTSGVELKVYPTVSGWNWSDPVDITDYPNWTPLYNSDTTWTEGAFNMNATGHPNYGWGVYDVNTHNLTGVALYIIKTRAGSYKKIWIMEKLSALQKFTFRYSDIDGSNEKTVIIDLAGSTKNFGYYSIDTNEEIDREPESSKWDIVFTKWMDAKIGYYPVTGVLQNIGVTAQLSKDTDPESKVFPSSGFLKEINTIGWAWKKNDPITHLYTIKEDSCVFFAKDINEGVYRIKFKTFEGSATGNITFDESALK
jgi:hypothetical protein